MIKSLRISREILYSKMSILIAQRGTCHKLQVGCVLVDNNTNRVIAMGYNSSFSGTQHCSDIGCLISNDHCLRCLHAEQAAIMNLEHRYDSISCYVTHQPCINCLKLLAAANINIIYYLTAYIDKSRELLNKELKIKMVKVII